MKAVFAHDDRGHDHQREQLKELGFVIGQKFDVARIEMGEWSTTVYLKDYPGKYFNSVNFSFEEDDGTPKDIFSDHRINPYYIPPEPAEKYKPFRGHITGAWQYGPVIAGYISDHPNFYPGEIIRTSTVKSITKNDDGTFSVETRNSKYNVTFAEGQSFTMS